MRLPRRSFQNEVDDRERSDYQGDDDDDPDANGSDHPTTPRHHKPPTRLCETLTTTGLELLTDALELTPKPFPAPAGYGFRLDDPAQDSTRTPTGPSRSRSRRPTKAVAETMGADLDAVIVPVGDDQPAL